MTMQHAADRLGSINDTVQTWACCLSSAALNSPWLFVAAMVTPAQCSPFMPGHLQWVASEGVEKCSPLLPAHLRHLDACQAELRAQRRCKALLQGGHMSISRCDCLSACSICTGSSAQKHFSHWQSLA